MRLLLVEDELEMAAALSAALSRYDMILDHAPSIDHAMAALASQVHDGIILDRQLPDGDGLSLIPRVRALRSGIPVIVLTARSAIDERVRGLDMGADDYLAKPFAMEELLARARAALRRVQPDEPVQPTLRFGDLEVDLARRLVSLGGEALHLTPTEYGLLEVLVTNPGKLLTHQWLLRKVWGQGYGTETTYLRTYVRALRKKLGEQASTQACVSGP